MIKNIYIAGPLFNVHERRYLEEIVQVLENHGYQCFLPHRDQSGINEADLNDGGSGAFYIYLKKNKKI